jgi:hypothetical protein
MKDIHILKLNILGCDREEDVGVRGTFQGDPRKLKDG